MALEVYLGDLRGAKARLRGLVGRMGQYLMDGAISLDYSPLAAHFPRSQVAPACLTAGSLWDRLEPVLRVGWMSSGYGRSPTIVLFAGAESVSMASARACPESGKLSSYWINSPGATSRY